jgi:succinate dehydrogenase flavin-adding protein (antitoxin of CptAB toxin-antitoxin module)
VLKLYLDILIDYEDVSMFQLDDKFLEEAGLGNLPQEQKKPFLQHIYNELEMRVGTKLSEGLSDDQLGEFEKIIDRDDAAIMLWLTKFAPNYYNDDYFKKIQAATGLGINDSSLRAEFVANKWLEINRPDYKQVVLDVVTDLKSELIAHNDVILGSN